MPVDAAHFVIRTARHSGHTASSLGHHCNSNAPAPRSSPGSSNVKQLMLVSALLYLAAALLKPACDPQLACPLRAARPRTLRTSGPLCPTPWPTVSSNPPGAGPPHAPKVDRGIMRGNRHGRVRQRPLLRLVRHSAARPPNGSRHPACCRRGGRRHECCLSPLDCGCVDFRCCLPLPRAGTAATYNRSPGGEPAHQHI